MKCPNCEYEDFTYTDDGEVAGGEGNFFKFNSQPLTQAPLCPSKYYPATAYLFGCPSCCTTFIEVQ